MLNPYDNLQEYVGQTLDFGEFCKLINEPIPKNNNEKKVLTKRLKNYIDFNLPIRKIKINSVLSDAEILLTEHKAKFTEYAEDMIVCYLKEDENNVFTYREMSKYLFLVSDRYYKLKDDMRKGNNINDIDFKQGVSVDKIDDDDIVVRKQANTFINTTDKLIKEIINNALKSLKNKSIIIPNETIKLFKSEYNMDLKKYINTSHICNEEELKIFLNLRRNVMKEHNIDKMQDVIYMKKDERDSFYKDFLKRLSECDELGNATSYASAYVITYGDKAVDYEYKRIQKENNFCNKGQNRLLLNRNMKYKLLTSKELGCVFDELRSQFVEKYV